MHRLDFRHRLIGMRGIRDECLIDAVHPQVEFRRHRLPDKDFVTQDEGLFQCFTPHDVEADAVGEVDLFNTSIRPSAYSALRVPTRDTPR